MSQQKKSIEWKKIRDLLKSGIDCAVLTSLLRVESRTLFEEFDHRGKYIVSKGFRIEKAGQRLHKNGKRLNKPTTSEDLLNTRLLWHGTGPTDPLTDPLTVVKHEQGLNPRFGKGL
jgi:hypothetical protein